MNSYTTRNMTPGVSQACATGYFHIHGWLPVHNLRHWNLSHQGTVHGYFTTKSTTVLALSTSSHPRASKAPSACTESYRTGALLTRHKYFVC